MTPDTFGDRKLYAILLAIALLGFVAVKCLAGCGPGVGPAQAAVRTATFMVRALCSDEMKVGECMDLLDERSRYLDGPDGGHE